MKTLFVLISSSLMLFQTYAKGPDTEADYIVPTSPQYVPFSRFKVDIVDRFQGPETQKISYVFPEFLTGEAKKVISMNRVPGAVNSWSGDELNAHCALIGDEFSCNIYVDKSVATALEEQAITNLENLDLTTERREGLEGVIRSFYSHEPAGFLSYDID